MIPPVIDDRPLPIFPCYPNKRPACEHGFLDATADPKRIAELWVWPWQCTPLTASRIGAAQNNMSGQSSIA